jgi:hypothetical protein
MVSVLSLNDNYPVYYYYHNDPDGALDATRYSIPGWRYQATNRQYWVSAPGYIGRAFFPNWGHYGGVNDLDFYDDLYDYQNIIQTQFSQAISYSAGFLQAASEALPPLVKNLKIGTTAYDQMAEIDVANGTDISFKILENRTQGVIVSIKARNLETGTEYPLVGNGATWSGKIVQLESGSELPWEKTITLSDWKGEMADGLLPNGKYELKVSVKDSDLNEVMRSSPTSTMTAFPRTIRSAHSR